MRFDEYMHEKKKTLRIAFDELELALERTRVRRHMLRNAFALFKLSCQRMREKNTLRIAFEEFELACERTRLTRHVLRSAFPVFKLSCQRMREEKACAAQARDALSRVRRVHAL